MSRIAGRYVAASLAFFAAFALAHDIRAASTVTLDVPPISAAGSAKGFEFTSFQFRVYLVPIGDAETDYSANVLANDYENYTYLHAGGGGSGRGGGYRPPSYVRIAGASYGDTYTNVTRPPTELDAFFHFSGADVAGLPLAVSVSDLGDYSLNLTADADPTHSPIVPGTPLSVGFYTLEYQTDSLLGSQVTFVVAPLPGDFNGDGIVDAADYTIWSDTLGSTTNLAADGNGNGTIDAGDYTVWLSNFGRTLTSGSGATITTTTVPEPATWPMLLSALAAFIAFRTSSIRSRTIA
jgi:hypothetical protein